MVVCGVCVCVCVCVCALACLLAYWRMRVFAGKRVSDMEVRGAFSLFIEVGLGLWVWVWVREFPPVKVCNSGFHCGISGVFGRLWGWGVLNPHFY
jgi:hypothetical protein